MEENIYGGTRSTNEDTRSEKCIQNLVNVSFFWDTTPGYWLSGSRSFDKRNDIKTSGK